MSLNRSTRSRVQKSLVALKRTATAPVETLEDRRLLAAALVADLATSAATADPGNLTRLGDALYFFANDSGGRELWKTDGTDAGTALVKDIYPGPGGSVDGFQPDPRAVLAIGPTLFFTARGDAGSELWKSDGTEAGTVLVKDIFPGATGSTPSGFAELDGALYFTATADFATRYLWKSDGTEAGTVRIGPAVLSTTSRKPFAWCLLGIGSTSSPATTGNSGQPMAPTRAP